MWPPQGNRRVRGLNSMRVSHIFCEEPPQGLYERVSRAARKAFSYLFGRTETQIEAIVDSEDDEAPPLERRYARGRWEVRAEGKQSRDTATQTELEDRTKRARDDDLPARSARPTKRRKRVSPFNRRSAPTRAAPGVFNPQHIERLKTGTCASARFLKKLREVSRPEPSPHESDLSCPNTPEAVSPARSASPEVPSTGARTPVHTATPECTARPETPKHTVEALSPVPLRISPEPAKSPEPTPPEPLFIEPPVTVEVEAPKPAEQSASQSTASDPLVASQTDSMQVSVEVRKPEPQSPQVTLPLASISSPASLASQTSNPFLSPAIAPATQYSFVFGQTSPEKPTSSMFPPPSVGAFTSADMAMTPTASFPSNPFILTPPQMTPFGQVSTPPSVPSFEAPSPAVFNSSASGQGGGFSLGILRRRPGSKK